MECMRRAKHFRFCLELHNFFFHPVEAARRAAVADRLLRRRQLRHLLLRLGQLGTGCQLITFVAELIKLFLHAVQLLHKLIGLRFRLSVQLRIFRNLLLVSDLVFQQLARLIFCTGTQCCLRFRLECSRSADCFLQPLFHTAFVRQLFRYRHFCLANFFLHVAEILIQHNNRIFHFIQ
ncbi:hypothetical protein D3C84_877350 [compost metagenome]